jgi:hypothetical protein
MGEMRHETSQITVGASAGAGHGEAALLFHPLADELMAIAARLRDAAEGSAASEPAETPSARPARPARNHLALARKAYALRRKRASVFGNPDLFGEPAWDILLDLYIAAGEGKPVSVSSACIGSAAPATTGLRWLGVLADEGLVVREADAEDHRRVLVRLTPAGQTAMDRFFDAVD